MTTTQQGTNYYGFGLAQRPKLSGRRFADNAGHTQRWMPMAEEARKTPFKGVTTDGNLVPGLYPIRPSGYSTRPIVDAAKAFVAGLDVGQTGTVMFDIDADEWRTWFNISPFVFRHGLMLEDLTETQREAALAMIAASMSSAGFESMRNCMRLNHTIGEITGAADEYGEWVYFLSLFGTPSETEPWGWQLDGHHVNLNCFVLGDQVVFTPAFLGSEPVIATSGIFDGVSVMQEEEQTALKLMHALAPAMQNKATVSKETHGAFAGAFRDNFELQYEGLRAAELSSAEQTMLWEVVRTYAGRVRDDHSDVKIDELREHMAETYFAWMGECEADSVFYYRVHSPVILIEFDHQGGVAFDNKVASRNHIHTLVRTPNGNDYGKDLLRQHHEAVQH